MGYNGILKNLSLGFFLLGVSKNMGIYIPQNGWFIRETPIKMDDLGVPVFLETPIYFQPSAISRRITWMLPKLLETIQQNIPTEW